MRLQDFEKYENITIQCHDNPDADALGSGYGLYCYFKSKNKNVRFIYSGRFKIQKSNLVLMLEKIGINITYIPIDEAEKLFVKGILIMTDCQYGAGNVTKLKAENVAVIDHHQLETEEIDNLLVKSDMGSCSSVVWQLLKEAGYEVTDDNNLATALYYGLLTDTNSFAEIQNPVDRDMRDELQYNSSYISMFCNSNISFRELEIAGIAMLRYSYNEDYHFAVIRSQPCDPNVLGIISDFLLQVDQIYACVVYNEIDGGYKISVRSCVREVNASELASYLTEGIGSGGGHYQKAGGFISHKLYEEKYGMTHAEAYFNNRMMEYYEQYEMIYADTFEEDLREFKKYHKKNMPIGYVKATDILPAGTPILIRTIEGDMDLIIEDDLIIIIGIEGEVYPNRLHKFMHSYKALDIKYDFEEMTINSKYVPAIKNKINGQNMFITEFAHVCVSNEEVHIFARPLTSMAKVFTNWDKNRYMVGKEGDMLVVRSDDNHDVYVVDKKIFDITYDEA